MERALLVLPDEDLWIPPRQDVTEEEVAPVGRQRVGLVCRDHFVAGAPDQPDGSGEPGDLVGHGEVDVVVDGDPDDALEGGRHARDGQREHVVEGRVQDLGSLSEVS